MLVLTSFKLNWGSYIIFFAKTASKKIGTLICCLKFLSHEVSLYLYKSTICPCVEYCCHVWADAPSCYLELLDKLQKRICRTVGPSLATSLEPLHSITPPPHLSAGGVQPSVQNYEKEGIRKKNECLGGLICHRYLPWRLNYVSRQKRLYKIKCGFKGSIFKCQSWSALSQAIN